MKGSAGLRELKSALPSVELFLFMVLAEPWTVNLLCRSED